MEHFFLLVGVKVSLFLLLEGFFTRSICRIIIKRLTVQKLITLQVGDDLAGF
jgi:hypothetical protein